MLTVLLPLPANYHSLNQKKISPPMFSAGLSFLFKRWIRIHELRHLSHNSKPYALTNQRIVSSELSFDEVQKNSVIAAGRILYIISLWTHKFHILQIVNLSLNNVFEKPYHHVDLAPTKRHYLLDKKLAARLSYVENYLSWNRSS